MFCKFCVFWDLLKRVRPQLLFAQWHIAREIQEIHWFQGLSVQESSVCPLLLKINLSCAYISAGHHSSKEVIDAYRSTCIRLKIKPCEKLIKQLEVFLKQSFLAFVYFCALHNHEAVYGEWQMHFKGHGTVNHKFCTECPSEKGLNPFVYLVENDIIQ